MSDCSAFIFKGAVRRMESVVNKCAYHRLIIILSGFCNVRWEQGGLRQLVRAGPGEVVYQSNELTWLEFNDPNPRVTSICIQFRWSNPWSEVCIKVQDRLGLIHSLADAILSVQPSSSPNRRLMQNSYLAAALGECRRLLEQEGEGLVAGVTRYAYDHIREHIGLADLARSAGFSPRHFQRQFKQRTGRSPMQYVRLIRVQVAARRLIGLHPAPLKDLAMRVGVCSEHALCRLLKSHTGLTASQLRAGRNVPHVAHKVAEII